MTREQPDLAAPGQLQAAVEVLPFAVEGQRAFRALYAESRVAFWLDSSRVEPGLSRFSFLGDASGPLGEVITYSVDDDHVTIKSADGASWLEDGDIFDVLQRRLQERAVPQTNPLVPFTCGYVGYFGYELKDRCVGSLGRHRSAARDAIWAFADRLIAIDHEMRATYLLAVHAPEPVERAAAEAWLKETAIVLRCTGEVGHVSPGAAEVPQREAEASVPLFVRSPAQYLDDIGECLEQLAAGESYQICLTNKAYLPFDGSDLDLYCRLREANPAPYAAFLRFEEISVLSSSPERFLKVDLDGTVESKPIKGTAPRSNDPRVDDSACSGLSSDPKTRAENLMIVDLVRNDLGQVCDVGSVHVPALMVVESYATLHQLVSTVRGHLRPGTTAVQAAKACFPGGSMTGAPKFRAMEIIDRLETEARGVYSGALGYFSLDGRADLSIVIRAAVRVGAKLSIGAGGAIVLGSNPQDELEEMLLKAGSVLRAVGTSGHFA